MICTRDFAVVREGIPDGHRWGLHNLRHSLSNWLVNKAKGNPKTVQGILGHSRIHTTFDLYTDEDLDEMIAAQGKFIDAVGIQKGDRPMRMWVQLWIGLLGAIPSNLLKRMAGTTGLEPAASAVTGQRSNQLNYVPNLFSSG